MIVVSRFSLLRTARRAQLSQSPARLSALSRLLSTLAVLEQRNGELQSPSLAAIAAAKKLGGSITAFVAGSHIKSTAAIEASKIKGVEKVVAVENDVYEKVRHLLTI
jgi:electron transfer flavoprotein alpha subunit